MAKKPVEIAKNAVAIAYQSMEWSYNETDKFYAPLTIAEGQWF